ncbi:MAG: glycosyltransferase family 2 protein [Candidatus Gastranaerophilales bacterium]|nr:glycosyltransferase family 2 protein [Candidatus Gastranaerophilales bacterium]
MEKQIAFIVPCLNEALTIGKVIAKIEEVLPEAIICVIDNNSTDNTVEEAQKFPKVTLLHEYKAGKANAVKKAFDEIDADIYIMVDADDTYDLSKTREYLKYFNENDIDYMNVKRKYLQQEEHNIFRRLGNRVFNKFLQIVLGSSSDDVLSGFKLMSKKFVKSFDIKSGGFELETEIFLFAKHNNFKTAEMVCDYYPRIENSYSKLSFWKDGTRILKFILCYNKR